MGLLTDFARGIANATGNGLLDRLCRENGWNIDERHGDTIALYFTGDRVTPRRSVYITHGGKAAMSFFCHCRAEFTDGRNPLPDDLLDVMIVHNSDVSLGGWAAKVDGDTVSLRLQYTAMAAGMTAASFKAICGLMVNEVAKVEASLQRKGLM